MPLIISHPETNPKIRKVEDEISAKKEELAKLIAVEKGTIITDYTFQDKSGNDILLSDMFREKEELIIVFYMGIHCKYCTLWGDNYNGIAKPLSDRAAFVVVSNETPQQQQKIRKDRSWNFDMFSRKNNSFGEDLGFVGEEENPLPGVATFSKKGDEIYVHHRSYFGPGDNYCNMWDFVSILPKGINNWQPKYTY
ncbi:MAG: DUF899 family protein [Flavobacteriales bacterium]|nr:DUF899 family protein [Flavobacteriales bacterium]